MIFYKKITADYILTFQIIILKMEAWEN